jgi:hypothetical protein
MRLVCLSLVVAGMLGAAVAGGVRAQAVTAAQAGGGAATGQGAGLVAVPAAGRMGSRTALLMGQVVDGSTGKPISDAIVSIGVGGGGRGPGLAVAPGGRAGEAPPQRVLVDAQGRFLFRDLPEGAVTLSASKPGYFGGGSGQQSPRGQTRPIDLADAERMGGVTLRLWAYGIVSGTVLDETGLPVTGINVQLIKRSAQNGRWQFSITGATAQTDDRGAFRFGSVLPGDYIAGVRSDNVVGEQLIMALVLADEASAMKMLPKLIERGEDSILIDSSVRMYPATFYPGLTEAAQATIIPVESGVERGHIDFRVKTVSARKVAGFVSGPNLDVANASVNLRLKPADSSAWDADINPPTAQMDSKGHYVFGAVPAGRYILEAVSRPRLAQAAAGSRGVPIGGRGALPPAPDAPTLYATLPVTVGEQNISDLEITLSPSGRVSGRVEFDGADRPTDDLLNQIFVTLEPADGSYNGSIARGRVEADGTFRTASLQPGRYLLRVGTLSMPASTALAPGAAPAAPGAGAVAGGGIPGQPRVWRPKSATINGRDPLDQPIDLDIGDITSVLVTFTDKPQIVLSGGVRDAKGDPDPQAVVLAFPTDNRLWSDFSGASRRIKVTRTSRYGVYSIAGLAAGEYYIAVGTDDRFADMQAPGALDSYTKSATRVVLVDGQPKTLDLKSGGR